MQRFVRFLTEWLGDHNALIIVLFLRDTVTSIVILGIVVGGNKVCRLFLDWEDPKKTEFRELQEYLHYFEEGLFTLVLLALLILLIRGLTDIMKGRKS